MSLGDAVEYARISFSDAVRGYAHAAQYTFAVQNASRLLRRLKPEGCSREARSTELHLSSRCSAWWSAAVEVARTQQFFKSLGDIGRREIAREGHVDLPYWERSNWTGAMMDTSAHKVAIECAFQDMVSALRRCAPDIGNSTTTQSIGPFFPFSGTLIALLRYGALVGELPGGRFDFVDADLDFTVMIPGADPWRWTREFVPCVQAALLEKSVGGSVVWTCVDATDKRTASMNRASEMPSSLDSDYLLCERRPLEADMVEQSVHVDVVRLLSFPGSEKTGGRSLGGWQRDGSLSLDLFLPAGRCKAGNDTVPCPRKSLDLFAHRHVGFSSTGFSSGKFSCQALPEVTSQRCSYNQANLALMRSGISLADIEFLQKTATALNASGFSSMVAHYEEGGCVWQRWRDRVTSTLPTDSRDESSMHHGSRTTPIGGEPLRLFFHRFRAFARVFAIRKLIQRGMVDVDAALRDTYEATLGVPPCFSDRLLFLLRRIANVVLSLTDGQSDTWHAVEFRGSRPLEYCVSLLVDRALNDMNDPGLASNFEPPIECSLESSASASAIAVDDWASIIDVLRHLTVGPRRMSAVGLESNGAATQPACGPGQWEVCLRRLRWDAAVDMDKESWAFGFMDATFRQDVDLQRQGWLVRRRVNNFAPLVRMFVAHWAVPGQWRDATDFNQEPHESRDAWKWQESDDPDSATFVPQMKELAEAFLALAQSATWCQTLDPASALLPQAICASLLLREYFQNCAHGSAEATTLWTRERCTEFTIAGHGPWYLTGVMLWHLVRRRCPSPTTQSSWAISTERSLPLSELGASGDDSETILSMCLKRIAIGEVLTRRAWESIRAPLSGVVPGFANFTVGRAGCLAAAVTVMQRFSRCHGASGGGACMSASTASRNRD